MENHEILKAEIQRLENEKRDLLWGVRACLDDFVRRSPDFKESHRTALVINRLNWMLKSFSHEGDKA